MKAYLILFLSLICLTCFGQATTSDDDFTTLRPRKYSTGAPEDSKILERKQTRALADLAEALDGKGTNQIRIASGITISQTNITLLSPTATTVNIAAVNTSYRLPGTNLVRLIEVYNTNSSTIYLLSSTNGAVLRAVSANGYAKWDAPYGCVVYDTNFWLTGATGVVNIVRW